MIWTEGAVRAAMRDWEKFKRMMGRAWKAFTDLISFLFAVALVVSLTLATVVAATALAMAPVVVLVVTVRWAWGLL